MIMFVGAENAPFGGFVKVEAPNTQEYSSGA